MAPAPPPPSDILTTFRPDLPEDIHSLDFLLSGVDIWGPPYQETVLHRLGRIRSGSQLRPSTAPGGAGDDTSHPAGASYVPWPGAAPGAWRPVSCRVSKVGNEAILQVHEGSTPLRTLNIHSTHSTDFRPMPRALFTRPHVLAIHTHPAALPLPLSPTTSPLSPHSPSPISPLSTSPTSRPPSSSKRPKTTGMSSTSLQPFYLAFTTSHTLSTFLSLLRALARPDVRGAALARETGGLYRCYRRLSIQLLSFTPSTPSTPPAGVELCALLSLNGDPCTPLPLPPSPANHESIPPTLLSDLPKPERIILELWRVDSGKRSQATRVGTAEIPATVLRNRWHEERWEVVPGGGGGGGVGSVGGVRCRVRLDDVLILPWSEYAPLHTYLSSLSLPSLFSKLRNVPGLQGIDAHLAPIGLASQRLVRDLVRLARREIGETKETSAGALFRSNNALLNGVSAAFRACGPSFLEASIGPLVRQVVRDRAQLSACSPQDLKRLAVYSEQLWGSIQAAQGLCPPELRQFLHSLRKDVAARFGASLPQLALKTVSFFSLFAYIAKAMQYPQLYDLVDGPLEEGVRETLVLLSKIVHGLSLFNTQLKEEKLQPLNSFLTDNRESAERYLLSLSSTAPPPPTTQPNLARTIEAIEALESRLPPLHGQAIPTPRRPRDLPREYALFAGAVTAAIRDRMSEPVGRPATTAGGPSASSPPPRPSTGAAAPNSPSNKAPPEEWETLRQRCLGVQAQVDARHRRILKEMRHQPTPRTNSPQYVGYHLPSSATTVSARGPSIGGYSDENSPLTASTIRPAPSPISITHAHNPTPPPLTSISNGQMLDHPQFVSMSDQPPFIMQEPPPPRRRPRTASTPDSKRPFLGPAKADVFLEAKRPAPRPPQTAPTTPQDERPPSTSPHSALELTKKPSKGFLGRWTGRS